MLIVNDEKPIVEDLAKGKKKKIVKDNEGLAEDAPVVIVD